MADHELNFSEAFDSTALNHIDKTASAGIQVSAEALLHGSTQNDLSAVSGQLLEAAFRAQDGDHEAAKVHIAHAVALLQCALNSGPTEARVVAAEQREGSACARSNDGGRRPTTFPHRLDHVRLSRVLAYISRNFDDDITLAALAGVAGYSPFHFARKFTLAVGIPPHRYIRLMRLQRAMAELATNKLPLAEIALNAHFSSQASFTRAFHRAIGLTPKEYQRYRLRTMERRGFIR
jgi:AraC-like DNA-binding protein